MQGFIKLAGACCLVLAGALLGGYFSSRLARRVRSLRELTGFFTGVRSAIEYASVPMDRLVSEGIGSDAPPYLSDCLARMHRGTGFPEAFPRAVRAARGALALRESDLAALERLAARLGRSDARGESALISLGLSELEALTAEAETDQHRRGRLLRSLGVLGGLLGVVLFL